MNDKSKLLNITKVATHVGIPKRTLYDKIKDGSFPVQPVKGTHPRLWNIDHLNAWMNAQ